MNKEGEGSDREIVEVKEVRWRGTVMKVMAVKRNGKHEDNKGKAVAVLGK